LQATYCESKVFPFNRWDYRRVGSPYRKAILFHSRY
jgi:hypothetical protein